MVLLGECVLAEQVSDALLDHRADTLTVGVDRAAEEQGRVGVDLAAEPVGLARRGAVVAYPAVGDSCTAGAHDGHGLAAAGAQGVAEPPGPHWGEGPGGSDDDGADLVHELAHVLAALAGAADRLERLVEPSHPDAHAVHGEVEVVLRAHGVTPRCRGWSCRRRP